MGARVRTRKPVLRARYEYAPCGEPTLEDVVQGFVAEHVPEAVAR